MEKLAVLDSGGQYTKVIDRKVRELLVESHILPIHTPAAELKGYGGIIISGGPESVWQDGSPLPDPEIYNLGVPVLGICYGMHALIKQFGGLVSPHVKKEYGEMDIEVDITCPLFYGLDATQRVLMSHGDSVAMLPDGTVACAHSGDVIVAVYDKVKNVYGVQFHPEVDLTENGLKMLENFLRRICRFKEEYALDDRIQTAIEEIKAQVGKNKVIVLVSGGVDSAVTASLLRRALYESQIIAIHVDHGLMRKNESDIICEKLREQGIRHLIRINAQDAFYAALDGVTDPEEKRNIIGNMFIETVQKETEKLSLNFDEVYLAQGTLRPDLIESGNPDISSYAKKIKTHHNDVDIIRAAREKGRIVETNRDWHKDEVRKVARMLDLGEEIAGRQPFPGPGLGVRVLCSDGTGAVDSGIAERLASVLSSSHYKGRVMPMNSVGVQGDYRTYGKLVLLEGEYSGWDTLYNLSKNIANTIAGVNRVAYILKSDIPLSDIVLRKLYINTDSVPVLREADAIVTSSIPSDKINQTFAVLLPLSDGERCGIAIRTFVTNDFMTGRPAFIDSEVSLDTLMTIARRIMAELPISFVCYDVTSKPPATCEWE